MSFPQHLSLADASIGDVFTVDKVLAPIATPEWAVQLDSIVPIEVAVFNIGANVRFGITETTTRVYTKVWEMACLGGFLMGREAAKNMLPRGRGSIIFTGATASLRGREGFAAFAGAKLGG